MAGLKNRLERAERQVAPWLMIPEDYTVTIIKKNMTAEELREDKRQRELNPPPQPRQGELPDGFIVTIVNADKAPNGKQAEREIEPPREAVPEAAS